MTGNGLTGNGLTGNGLTGNGLTGNGLIGNWPLDVIVPVIDVPVIDEEAMPIEPVLEIEVDVDERVEVNAVEPPPLALPVEAPEPEPPPNPALSAIVLGTCFTLSPTAARLVGDGNVFSMAAAIMLDDETVVADETPSVVDDAVGVASLWLITSMVVWDGCCMLWLVVVATRSLRKVLALTPLRSLWTQFVNWAFVGPAPRTDSNSPVTTCPAWVFARFSAAGWATSAACAFSPAPDSSTRSSRHEVAPERDGTQRRSRRRGV